VHETMKLGEHYICDLSGCSPELLMDPEKLYGIFSRAVRESGLTVVQEGQYEFSPHGFTCFLLLAESHASLHAWPEYGYCAVDLFTCNLGKDLAPLIEHLSDVFDARGCTVHKLDREADVRSTGPARAS
jgi:S-adenosylmethionine decarboxylase proenzyme